MSIRFARRQERNAFYPGVNPLTKINADLAKGRTIKIWAQDRGAIRFAPMMDREDHMRTFLAAGFGLILLSVTTQGAVAAKIEPNTNRLGGDYKSVTLKKSAKPKACRNLCKAEGACKAWTYVNPGIQGDKPRCWLKNIVPPATPNPCCTSGVK